MTGVELAEVLGSAVLATPLTMVAAMRERGFPMSATIGSESGVTALASYAAEETVGSSTHVGQ